MTRHRARYAKIERMVDAIVGGMGLDPVPVRLDTLLDEYGITLRQGDLGEVSGLLLRGADEPVIGVNAKQHRTRRRFTIAHEFGHFLLHEGIFEHVDLGYRVNFRSNESSMATNVEEIEANFFAASLLMPKRQLDLDGAVEALDDDEAVGRLAKRYDVSRHAMSLRLVNLYRPHSPY